MQTGLAALALKKLSDRRKRAALMIGAMGVVFATTYALILPALTIDQEAAEQQPGMAVEQVEAAGQAAGQDQTAAEATESAEAAAPEADAAEAPEAATAPNAQGEGAEGAEGAGESAAGEAANNATSDQEAGQSSAESNVTVSADGYAAGTLTATNGKYQAEVTFTEDAKLPEGTTLKITPLKAEGAEYQEAYNKLVAQKQAADASFDPAAFEYTVVDITLYDAEGNEIEPAAPVQVKLTTPSTVEGAKPADVQVHHLNDQTNKVEVVAGEGTGSIKLGEATVSEFQVDSFSKFVVETIAAATTMAATPTPIATEYTATFNKTGGKGTPFTQNTENGGILTFPGNKNDWTNGGKKFVGWSTSSSATLENGAVVYREGDTLTLTKNTNFYTVWAETITVTFNRNQNTSDTTTSSANAGKGNAYLLPDLPTTWTNGEKLFIGWSTNKGANNPRAFDANPAPIIYEVGDKVTVSAPTTFYAIWAEQNVTSSFYIAINGGKPLQEPGVHDKSNYTGAFNIERAIKVDKFYTNQAGVNDNLNSVPNASQMALMLNGYTTKDGKKVLVTELTGFNVKANDAGELVVDQILDSSKVNPGFGNLRAGDALDVIWYVTKTQTTNSGSPMYDYSTNNCGRHVDGVLIVKHRLTLTYDPNAPTGALNKATNPDGSQWDSGASVKAGCHAGNNNEIRTPLRNDGWVFDHWDVFYDTDNDGKFTDSGVDYASGQDFVITQDTHLVAHWVRDTANLKLLKTDEAGNPLDGATFKLINQTSGTSQQLATTNGAIDFGQIELGVVYRVEEVSAPAGYKTIAPFYFKEVQNGETYSVQFVTEAGDNCSAPSGVTEALSGKQLTLTVQNQPYLTNVSVKKVDESGNPLPGATFQLKKDQAVLDGYGSIQPAGTDASVTLENLRDGNYTLIETGAPDGYIQVAQPIEFTIANGAVQYTDSANDNVSFANNTFTVTNQAGQALPNTGGPGTHLHTFFGALLVLLAAGGMYVSRRRLAGRGGN